MNEKFAFSEQNKNQLNQKLNINVMDLSNFSPCKAHNIQATYDAISVLYSKEIESITHFLEQTNSFKIFSKENFSNISENFKEIFGKLNININFYQIKNLDEIITKVSTFNCTIALIEVLNDKNDTNFFSKFFDSQNIPAINFTNCNTSLYNKMSIDVDWGKNILKSLNTQEKLKIFLDCISLSLQTKRILDLNFKIKM